MVAVWMRTVIPAMTMSHDQKSAMEFAWLMWQMFGPKRNDTPVATMAAVKTAPGMIHPMIVVIQ